MKNDSPYHSLTSWSGQTKRLAAISSLVVVVIALIYYFSLPAHGERVGTPPDLVFTIREHFKHEEHRGIEAMASYKCNRFTNGDKLVDAPDYIVDVVLETRLARKDDDERSKRWVVLATSKEGRNWELVTLLRTSDFDDNGPCVR